MNNLVFGAFFTDKTMYEQICNDYFTKSIGKFKLCACTIRAMNYGNWHRNVAEKPKIILNILNNLTNADMDLVFLDADATIEQKPILFETIPKEYDIAFHTLDWKTWYGYKDSNVKELLTGTMFFRSNDKTKDLCREWYAEAIKTKIWEQKVLERILPNHDLKIFDLPLSYCYIKSRPQNQEPLVKLDPVILHHQVSREFKLKRMLR